MVLAAATLLDRAGAKRIRFLEGTYQLAPMEEYLQGAGWDLKRWPPSRRRWSTRTRATSARGAHTEVKVPGGGSLYPAYLLNHSYVDCDVYVSLAKLKNHATAGVTLSMKNNFGITPTALYAQHERTKRASRPASMSFMRARSVRPTACRRSWTPTAPRRPSYRVPRVTADMVGIRPIDLAIIDGVETVSGGEGPWLELKAQQPGLFLMGRNPVCTDAVATTVMGYDPMAKSATGPFPGDNHLALAADLGLGTINPKEIEVVGLSVEDARYPFRWEPAKRDD